MALTHANDPLLRTLAELNDHVERTSAERRAAIQQATQNIAQNLQQRAEEQERAEVEKLAVSMTGREGQGYMNRNRASRTAQEAMPSGRDSDGVRQSGFDDVGGGLEPEDLAALAAQEEEDTLGEQVGNRMSGRAYDEAVLQQKKDRYRESEFEPFAGTESQRGQARLAQAANSARQGVNDADALEEVRRMMSNGFTSANSPTAAAAPAPAVSPEKARMLAALEQAKTNPYRDPQHDEIMAQLSRVQPDGTMGSGGPSPSAARLDAAMAPVAQMAALPPIAYPAPPPPPQMAPPGAPAPVDPGLAAYLASIGVR